LSAAALLLFGAWFGVVTGLGEDVMLVVRHHWFDRGLNFNPHWFWMKPIADVALFGFVASLIVVIGRWLPRLAALRGASFVFIMAGSYAVLMMVPGLDNKAGAVLALGLAWSVSGALARRSSGFVATMRRTAPWLLLVCAGLPVATYFGRSLPRAAGGPAPAGAPNVLLIVLDTVRAESLSLYGYERQTSPRLDEWAKRGVTFSLATTASPWTLPSHAAMFTGRYPHEVFDRHATPLNAMTPMGPRWPTLAELLGQHGYQSVGFVANLTYGTRAHGLHRGFEVYDDYAYGLEDFLKSAKLTRSITNHVRRLLGNYRPLARKSAAEVNQAFLSWCGQKRDRPFFAFLNYFDTHDPYLALPPFVLKFGDELLTHRSADTQVHHDAYDSCLAYLDHHVGNLLDQLKRDGVLDNTVVIITSDHGEQFGEHGYTGHINTLYRHLLHVPLLVSFNGNVPADTQVEEPVSTANLGATILELIGMNDRIDFPGNSMTRYWTAGAPPPAPEDEQYLAELLVGDQPPRSWKPEFPGYAGGMRSLVARGHHYIQYWKNGELQEELYDIYRDPAELHDLVDRDGHHPLLDRYRTKLEDRFEE